MYINLVVSGESDLFTLFKVAEADILQKLTKHLLSNSSKKYSWTFFPFLTLSSYQNEDFHRLMQYFSSTWHPCVLH